MPRRRDLIELFAWWMALTGGAAAWVAARPVPSASLTPANLSVATLVAAAAFALFVGPAIVLRSRPENSSTPGLCAWGAPMAALAALGAPLAWVCADLAEPAPGETVAGWTLVGIYLAGGLLWARASGLRPPAAARVYVAAALAAAFGAPLVGYLAAEIHGQDPVLWFRICPWRGLARPLEPVGEVPLWIVHAFAYGAALVAMTAAARLGVAAKPSPSSSP